MSSIHHESETLNRLERLPHDPTQAYLDGCQGVNGPLDELIGDIESNPAAAEQHEDAERFDGQS